MRKLTEPTLWHKAELNHPDVPRIPEPRIAKPLHIECEDPLGRGLGTVDLMEVSREELLEHFGFPPLEPESYRNLQIWLNHQGPALYNPIWWIKMESRLSRHTRYPHTIGFMNDLHGSHRCRALERLQFPYIYVYIHNGPTFVNPSNPEWNAVSNGMSLNDMEPIVYTEHGICEKCGSGVRWGGPPKTGNPRTSGTENFKATIYTCGKCGHIGQRPEIYPEPV